MIYTCTGANRFALQSALTTVREAFIAEYTDLALESVDVSDWELRRIFDSFAALPFLSAKRLLLVSGLAAIKWDEAQLQALLASSDDSSDIYIIEPKLDKRGVVYKTLKKYTTLQEFTEPDPRDMPKWVTSYVASQKGTISAANAALLVQRIGAQQQRLATEIDKLLLYDPNITKETIELLTDQAPQSSIFELIDAAFAGNLGRAIELYDDQRAQNVDPLAIEALFVWQLHAIALAKTAGNTSPDALAAESGLSPFTARKSASLAAKRSMQEIKRYVSDLLAAEFAMKTTAADADALMKNYIISLA